ncbi:hypothetical protein TL16_g06911 [Triparma laevis f. inornata]|uniref:Serine aminopeptidase S33 domain-containing protein n=1 Tax=Triparma laevis f. inornata TaxID=1714386 RepID=A0A9W7ATW9_9STRA|nr:hypothetical protein TL16_g06911 [Triparma laevis f. inornata]
MLRCNAFNDNLLYHPSIQNLPLSPQKNPAGFRSPLEYGIPFSSLKIPTTDNIEIHAWLLLHPDSLTSRRPTIIFFHGNAGNIGFRLPNAQQMYQLGYNIMQVEYRAFGDSDQSKPPSEEGLRRDAEASINWIMNHGQIDKSRVFLFGRSLGGAVAFHLAKYCDENSIPLAGVIVENTFLSIGKMVDVLMPLVAPLKSLILRIGWDNELLVPQIKVPILFLSGGRDELVPPFHMKRLYELATQSEKAVFYEVKDGTHNDTWQRGGRSYWEAFGAFVTAAVGAAQVSEVRSDEIINGITTTTKTTKDEGFFSIYIYIYIYIY